MKKIFLMMAVFLMAIILWNCSKDDYPNLENKEAKNVRLSAVTWAQLQKKPKAIEKLRSVLSGTGNHSLTARYVFDANYGVFIDTTYILRIEEKGTHTFTMRIKGEKENEVENLILKSNTDGSYKAYMAKYNLSAADMVRLSNGDKLADKKPDSIKDMESYARFSVIGDGAECVRFRTIHVKICENANHEPMVDNGDVDNGCVRPLYEIDYLVLSFREGCLGGGGGDFGPPAVNPGIPGSGVNTGGGSTGTGDGNNGTGNTGTGNNGNNNNNNDDGNGPIDPNDPSLTEDPINTAPVLDDRTLFERTLDDDQLDWWRDPDNADDKQHIKDYMNEPDSDINTAKAIIDNEIDGGDTDFENKIMLDDSFKNNQKANCVYEKMKNNQGFKNFTEPFNFEKPDAFVKLQAGPVPDNDRAFTEEPDENNIIVITINNHPTHENGINQQPNLLICQTIIHEIIHAEFFRRIIEVLGDYPPEINQQVAIALNGSKYQDLANYIAGLNDWSHNLMAEKYRRSIARVTQEFDTGQPVTGLPTDDPYMLLAWRGLDQFDVEAWMIIPQSTRAAIGHLIENYINLHKGEPCQ